MIRRGLTLLEMLLAISLLSGLVLVSVAWTSSVARAGVVEQDRSNWTSAAHAVLQLIGEDMTCGDLALRPLDEDGEPEWLESSEGGLWIQVRQAPFTGAERAVYMLDEQTGSLTRRIESEEDRSPLRLLLGSTSEFEITISDSGAESDRERSLTVTLRSPSGEVAASVFDISDRSGS